MKALYPLSGLCPHTKILKFKGHRILHTFASPAMPTLKPKLVKECNLPNTQDYFVNFEIVDLKPSSEKPVMV